MPPLPESCLPQYCPTEQCAQRSDPHTHILGEVARDPQRCVIVVTHDPRILGFAGRVAEMEDGRILKIGPQTELKQA